MLFPQNKNSYVVVSLCVAPTETLLENWFAVLELNAVTKTHKTAVNFGALTALHCASNTISCFKRKIKKKNMNEMACLPAWPYQADSTTLCLYKSQPDSGGRCRRVNLWEPFGSQITSIWYWPWSYTCMGHTLCLTRTFPVLGSPCLFRPFSWLSGPRLKIPQVT